jgi:segregation and condensation protein B
MASPETAAEPTGAPAEPEQGAGAGSGPGKAAALALETLSIPARLEAILYLKGRPLTLAELAELADLERETAELALITLMADYAHRDTALEIHQEGSRYSLQLREGLGDLVQNLLPVDLSTASLRTLATIALKKRILQSELVELRGSGAYDHIKELLAQDFIERRRQSDGRSYWLSLSEKFHRTFAVQGQDSRARGLGGPDRRVRQLEIDAEARLDHAATGETLTNAEVLNGSEVTPPTAA